MTPIRGLVNSLVKEDSYELWHQHFGHIAKNALRQTPFHVTGLPTVIAPVDTSPCKGCALGKMHDRSYPASGKRATRPLGLVHTDLVGPMPTESRTCARYVLTFIDDYSGYALMETNLMFLILGFLEHVLMFGYHLNSDKISCLLNQRR